MARVKRPQISRLESAEDGGPVSSPYIDCVGLKIPRGRSPLSTTVLKILYHLISHPVALMLTHLPTLSVSRIRFIWFNPPPSATPSSPSIPLLHELLSFGTLSWLFSPFLVKLILEECIVISSELSLVPSFNCTLTDVSHSLPCQLLSGHRGTAALLTNLAFLRSSTLNSSKPLIIFFSLYERPLRFPVFLLIPALCLCLFLVQSACYPLNIYHHFPPPPLSVVL